VRGIFLSSGVGADRCVAKSYRADDRFITVHAKKERILHKRKQTIYSTVDDEDVGLFGMAYFSFSFTHKLRCCSVKLFVCVCV